MTMAQYFALVKQIDFDYLYAGMSLHLDLIEETTS